MTTWEKIELRRRRFERMFTREFRKALHEQVKPVLENIDVQFVQNYQFMIPILVQEADIMAVFIRLYQKVGLAFRDSFIEGLKRKKINYNTKNLEDDLWLQSMQDYAELVASGRVKMMTETTKQLLLKMVRDSIRKGTDNGLSIESMTTKIRHDVFDKYGKFERWRARRIAQTEVMSASNYASYKSAKDSEVTARKRWLTAPGGLSKTERHTLIGGLEDQRPMMNEPFNVDGYMMMHPGDPSGEAKNVINCKCAIGYETIEI